ncbi:MAG: hypothetical protein EYC62_04585 [Alphaproteobacteria bacterium]|nr:MAG: hypothetical protein EYC62_04585 [Alphaproteobacteria bacterium]
MMKRIKKILNEKAELLLLCFLLGFCLTLIQPAKFQPVASVAEQLARDFAFPPATYPTQGIITVAHHADLDQIFSAQDYDLRQLQSGGNSVPAIFLTRLPTDLHEIETAQDKKDLFIRSVLPLVLLANDHIIESRKKLIAAWNKQRSGTALTADELEFIANLSEEYNVPDQDMAKLAMRVDVIPPSLAIAQAAEESGWGTSRFTRHGNALFGQQVYGKQSGGILPLQRETGRQHLVRSFDNLFGTVLSYTQNLNTHPAYENFRRMRAGFRYNRQYMDSNRLIETMNRYSERGEKYVQTIKRIIDANDLQSLDRAKLEASNTDYWRQRMI